MAKVLGWAAQTLPELQAIVDDYSSFKLVGARYDYIITVVPNPSRPLLACCAQTKQPALGESRLRFSDLSGGMLTLTTWADIVKDIKGAETGENL